MQRSSAFVGKLALENGSLKEGLATVVRRQGRLMSVVQRPGEISVSEGWPADGPRSLGALHGPYQGCPPQFSRASALCTATTRVGTPRLPQKLRLFSGLI